MPVWQPLRTLACIPDGTHARASYLEPCAYRSTLDIASRTCSRAAASSVVVKSVGSGPAAMAAMGGVAAEGEGGEPSGPGEGEGGALGMPCAWGPAGGEDR